MWQGKQYYTLVDLMLGYLADFANVTHVLLNVPNKLHFISAKEETEIHERRIDITSTQVKETY